MLEDGCIPALLRLVLKALALAEYTTKLQQPLAGRTFSSYKSLSNEALLIMAPALLFFSFKS